MVDVNGVSINDASPSAGPCEQVPSSDGRDSDGMRSWRVGRDANEHDPGGDRRRGRSRGYR